MAYERMLLERFSDSSAFSEEWAERNDFMLSVLRETLGGDNNFSFTEYGCGPNAPFKNAVSSSGVGEVTCYDVKRWEHENKIVDLNNSDFSVEKTDVGVLSGVIEYLNNFENTLGRLANFHKFILLSYSTFPMKLKLNEDDYLKEVNRRALMNGWHNHFDAPSLIENVRGSGFVVTAAGFGNQTVILIQCS